MPTEDELNSALNSDDGNIPKGTDEPVVEPEEPVEEAAEEPEEQPEEAPAPEPQLSPSQKRVLQALEKQKRAEAEAQVLRETAERYRQQAEQASQERRRQEDELLDPSERRLRNAESMAQNAHLASLDAADRASFSAKSSSDGTRARYIDRVEAEISKARSQGQMASREGVYVYLRGQDAIAAEQKAGLKRRQSADEVRQQRGRPASPTSDKSPNRVKSLEEKLKDVAI